MATTYYGQAHQDKYVLNVLKEKRNGFFLEIGSNDPVFINNTYLLESQYDWRGIMVEYCPRFLQSYKEKRPNSTHVIQNAITIDYKKLLEDNNAPTNIDYLQIDLEVENGSTIDALIKMDNEIFDKYKFATITFEHDNYCDNYLDVRGRSREIFAKRGYYRVFDDIYNNSPELVYEDWYVHPDLVDMKYILELQQKNATRYEPCNRTGRSLGWFNIIY